MCTTDADHNQIGSFYTGAMSEARQIELKTVADRVGGLDLVLHRRGRPRGDDPAHRGVPHPLASRSPPTSPSRSPGWTATDIRTLLEGAAYLFSNEYEKGLIESKTGWTDEEILAKVGTRVTTLGAKRRPDRARGRGARSRSAVPEEERKADPTGVGDAFRAGFLSGLSWGVGLERAAQVGCMLATLVIETVGTQEYELRRAHFMDRFTKALRRRRRGRGPAHLD